MNKRLLDAPIASLAAQFSTKTLILVYFTRRCSLCAPGSVQLECDQRRWKKNWHRNSAKRNTLHSITVEAFASTEELPSGSKSSSSAGCKQAWSLASHCLHRSAVQQTLLLTGCTFPPAGHVLRDEGFYIRWHPKWENQNTWVPLTDWAQESKLAMHFFKARFESHLSLLPWHQLFS